MITFVMLTRIAADAVRSPRALEDLERDTMGHVRAACPSVMWGKSYAALGRYDYVDVFQAPDVETAMKVAVLVRAHGHADTEVWPVMEWDHFRSAVLGASENGRERLVEVADVP